MAFGHNLSDVCYSYSQAIAASGYTNPVISKSMLLVLLGTLCYSDMSIMDNLLSRSQTFLIRLLLSMQYICLSAALYRKQSRSVNMTLHVNVNPACSSQAATCGVRWAEQVRTYLDICPKEQLVGTIGKPQGLNVLDRLHVVQDSIGGNKVDGQT